MKNLKQMLGIFLLCSLFVVLSGGEAYADDVLQAVRDKAANFLFRLRPVIFVLAAFGLVGFAWMAIFNKISWKWFANIAMGLFLVANMGLFIDYFATKSGRKGQYAEKLGYGSYLDTGYTATNGVGGDPQSQDVPGGDGTGTGDENGGGSSPNSNSDDFTGHSCTPGLDCGASASGGSSDDVANASGSSEDGSSDNGGDNPSAGDGDSGSSAGGTRSGQQKQDSNTATKGATTDSGSFSNDSSSSNSSSSQDNASANVSGEQASGAAEAYKALAGGDSVSGGDSSGDGASGDETASAQDAEPVEEEAKEKTEKELCFEAKKVWISNECVTYDERDSKIANLKRKCLAQEGYEWHDGRGFTYGYCSKTQKQGDKDCKKEKGKDYEWDSLKEECVKTKKALEKEAKEECKSKGDEYYYSDGECRSKKQDCEFLSHTVDGRKSGMYWKNGECVSKREEQKRECEAKGKDYIYREHSYGVSEDYCTTKKEICEKRTDKGAPFTWENGKCISSIEKKKQECKEKGKDYEWKEYSERCDKTYKAKKRECNETPGYFWSDDFEKCIKEE